MTNLLEVAPHKQSTKTAAEAWHLFRCTWLSRYPRPLRCVHDNGPEFNGHDFQFPLLDFGIRGVPISSNAPTANSIIESIHKSMGQVVRTMVALKPPQNKQEAERLVEWALATAMHASRCASTGALQHHSPGSLVFHRDMHLDMPLLADLRSIVAARQAQIDKRLLRANASRRRYDFKVGDHVYVTLSPKSKAQLTADGPHPIVRVHTNNAVTIQRGPVVQERLSIRWLRLHSGN